jgi:RNA polymerase sporulation-specific sigma factor
VKNDDYELVYLAQDGNEDAINIIYDKYKPIIIKKSKNAIVFVTHHGIEINDIMQEGYIGLEEAIRNFSQDNEATFYTFANLCIDRQILNFLRKINGNKDRILNEAIIIDDSLEKTLKDNYNVEENLLGKDNNEQITKKIRDSLTEFEKIVFDLRIKGYSFEEISNTLNKDLKSIYNTLQRIKVKFKKIKEIDD